MHCIVCTAQSFIGKVLLGPFCMVLSVLWPAVTCNSEHKCATICNFFRCGKSSKPPYRVISVQDIGNMERISQNVANDFVFDDQYLELNDCPISSIPSTNKSKQPNPTFTAFNDDSKSSSTNKKIGASKSYRKFCQMTERKTKSKYVRLDELYEDDKQETNILEDETTHGYWNPTYFSLAEESDV